MKTLSKEASLAFAMSMRDAKDYEYEIVYGKATIIGYKGKGGDVSVPPTIGGCPVVAIGKFAFYDCPSLTGVALPEGVLTIGLCAFDNCDLLYHVSLPSSIVTIGDFAFPSESKVTRRTK